MRTIAATESSPGPTQGRIPARKLFYRIQEVSKLTGLKPYVLRYWETEFKELAPGKDASDQRRYRQADIEVILAIRKLLYQDRFTIEGARKRLKDELRHVRGEMPADAASNGKPKAKLTVNSEKLALEDFIPAPVQEAATRAQKQARQAPPAVRTRPSVMRDVAPSECDEDLFQLRPEPAASLATPQLFETPAARPSASIISIAPDRSEGGAAVALAEQELGARQLEAVLGKLRAEVNELLEILS